MEYGDRSREPSVRRAPSRFVRRPGNPECGFVRRPTFLFLPRSFGLLLVALFAFSPPFLRQESRKESGRDACIPMLSSTVGTNSRACLFFSLPASPRLSTRFFPMQSHPSLLSSTNFKRSSSYARKTRKLHPSPLLSNWRTSTVFELEATSSTRILKPNHSIRWIRVTACRTISFCLDLSNRPNPKDFYQYELIFSDTILSCSLRIAIVPFVESVP